MTIDRTPNGLRRLLLPAAILVAAVLAVFAVLDALSVGQRAADRRALGQRNELLNASALAPGSALACLGGGAGEVAETACEAAIFASPQSTAAAVAYIGARLTLLADAQARDVGAATMFAASRRAIELDRFGIAAHVLAWRDGCTAAKCAAFAWLGDTNVLKANMKAQVFDQYVSRHSPAWNAPTAAPKPAPAMSQTQPEAKAAAAEPTAPEPKPGEQVAHPLSGKYDFPSAASIPPVSIMNAEPALPKAASEAQATQPNGAEARPAGGDAVPVPPKRPQERPQDRSSAQRNQADPGPAR
jgi:hypothetical protein